MRRTWPNIISQLISSSRLSPLQHPTLRRFTSSQASGSHPSRSGKYARRLGYITLGVGTIWAGDRAFNASAISRNFRTLATCAVITIDYKLNFTPEKSALIPELQERVAERMYKLLTSNGGLYIKIGQAIGANAALLPRAMQDKFAKLFDDAPQIPYSSILSVFKSEFGKSPHDMFEVFEEQAIASASIAQVHRAKIRTKPGDPEQWVAVKIQRPDVGKQVAWDLAAYRAVMWMFEHWAFDLPVYFVVDFISDHLKAELDFVQEADNAFKTAQFVANEPWLAGRVYIPKVYPELSTKRIMTAEWIDGVRLSDRPAIRRLMGESLPTDAHSAMSQNTAAFTFPSKPLKGGLKSIMQSMVDLFSAQMFEWGWVHCDPHPGNIIVRPNPQNPTQPQLVLLDHGLYVSLTEEFRQQYANLWKGLLATDYKAIENVTRQWGIGAPDLFASATLMKPIKLKGRDKSTTTGTGVMDEGLSEYERSVRMKRKLKSFLTDTDKMPKELIFLGRNMRMVQGNNQSMGSPVNRIKITGYWASRSLTLAPSLTFTQRLREYYYFFAFRSVMFSLDLAFWGFRAQQWVYRKFGLASTGFEDELERGMRSIAKGYGVDVPSGAFDG